jgi:hypothetical protein
VQSVQQAHTMQRNILGIDTKKIGYVVNNHQNYSKANSSINVPNDHILSGWIELRKGFHSYLTIHGDLIIFREHVLTHFNNNQMNSTNTSQSRNKKERKKSRKKHGIDENKSNKINKQQDKSTINTDQTSLLDCDNYDIESIFNTNLEITPSSSCTRIDYNVNKNSFEKVMKNSSVVLEPMFASEITKDSVTDSSPIVSEPQVKPNYRYTLNLEQFKSGLQSSLLLDIVLNNWNITAELIPAYNNETNSSNVTHFCSNKVLCDPSEILCGRFSYCTHILLKEDTSFYNQLQLVQYAWYKSEVTTLFSDTSCEEELISVPCLGATDLKLRLSLPLLVPVLKTIPREAAHVDHNYETTSVICHLHLKYEFIK